MLIAGVMSINVISEQAIVHRIGYGIENLNDRKKDYYLQIACNRARNLARNNTVSSCYKCIRNALVLLVAVMLIAIWPHNDKNNSLSANNMIASGNTVFFYSKSCFDFVNKKVSSDYVENFIYEQLNNGIDASNAVTVIDTNEKILIKFSGDKKNVNVYMVERYVKP